MQLEEPGSDDCELFCRSRAFRSREAGVYGGYDERKEATRGRILEEKYLSLHLGIVLAELPLTYSRLVYPRHNNTKSYRIWTAQIPAASLLNPRPISTIIRQPVNHQRVERCTSATIAPFSWASTAPTISTWGQTANCFAASFSV